MNEIEPIVKKKEKFCNFAIGLKNLENLKGNKKIAQNM